MELNDVQTGFELGTLKESIIEPSDRGNGWIILLRDEHDHLTPLTSMGFQRIFDDLYLATSFAHSIGSKQVSVLDNFM